ncbi:glycosyltransferase family 4 protein [Mesobacillus jeotgali]|uniref:glycosyltransferase family 4 protein n=1 Tax=Mesobacillus jeotgali TaxID=129985 RepID=UPI001CFE00A7|nr:glycosyltransferase family 4 protein [Mesobacillus jeotgali]
MKILYLCTFYHRAMIFRDSMNYLMKLGHEVKAFNAVSYNTKIDDKYKNIMDELVIHQECFTKWDRFLYHLKQRKIFNKLVSSYQVENFDIIHSHTLFNGGYVAYLVKKHFGVPYVVSVRNTDINVFLRLPIFVNIANRIVKDASGVLFLSGSYKEKFLNKYVKSDLRKDIENKSVVISNGLESFWLSNKSQPKRLSDKKSVNLLYVGNIDKNKNITTSIQAIKILIEKGYKVKFTIVGQATDKNILNNIKKEEFVEVIDFLTKEELIKVFRANDIFIMPSIFETFGRVYAESMTQGLPVIYTKGQGFDGIFEDGIVGYGVPSKDAKYISDCIIKILEDYTNISERCIDECEKFDWNYIAESLSRFYFKSLNSQDDQ